MSDLVKFLESLGFAFGLDLEGNLEIECPGDLPPPAQIGASLYTDGIKNAIQWRANLARRQCVGGPFNGQRHGHGLGCAVCLRERRAKWAAYFVVLDGRAFFCGMATSERKARRKAYGSRYCQQLFGSV